MLLHELAQTPHRCRSPKSLPGLELWLERPDAHTVIVQAVGDLDAATTPQLAELLAARLDSAPGAVVLDLSKVSFLGTQSLSVLVEAQQRAHALDVTLRLVTGPRCVARALRAAGLSAYFATQPTLREAVSAGTPRAG